jgi:uncharacterized Zn-finger protein
MKFEFVTSSTRPAMPESRRLVNVKRSDLPVSCPRKNEERWNLHPRVYIPLEESARGEAVCPYCGKLYKLIDDSDLENTD